MNCPYCEKKMQKGEVQIGSWSFFMHVIKSGETVLWAPEGECKKMVPKDAVHLQRIAEGYYCTDCEKVVAIFEKRGVGFWQQRKAGLDTEGNTLYSVDQVKKKSCEYYQEALRNDTHVAYLVFDGDEFVGAGGVSFFKVMPTFHNPTGEKAYIMNMYTKSEYRRQGIAFQTLDLLVAEARKKGIKAISLEATDMGRPLYAKYGFVKMNDEMELPDGQ